MEGGGKVDGSRKRIEDRKNIDYSSLKMVEGKDNIGNQNAT